MSGEGSNGTALADVVSIDRLLDAAETTSRRIAVDEQDIRDLFDLIQRIHEGETPWQRDVVSRLDAIGARIDKALDLAGKDRATANVVIQKALTAFEEMSGAMALMRWPCACGGESR